MPRRPPQLPAHAPKAKPTPPPKPQTLIDQLIERDRKLQAHQARTALAAEFPSGRPFSERFWSWFTAQSTGQTPEQILDLWRLDWPADDIAGLIAAMRRARRFLELKAATLG